MMLSPSISSQVQFGAKGKHGRDKNTPPSGKDILSMVASARRRRHQAEQTAREKEQKAAQEARQKALPGLQREFLNRKIGTFVIEKRSFKLTGRSLLEIIQEKGSVPHAEDFSPADLGLEGAIFKVGFLTRIVMQPKSVQEAFVKALEQAKTAELLQAAPEGGNYSLTEQAKELLA